MLLLNSHYFGTLLPIHSDIAPYYNWKDLKAYCQQRIALAKDIIKRTQLDK